MQNSKLYSPSRAAGWNTDREPEEIADDFGIPVIATDFGVTRRIKVHQSVLPGSHETYTASYLLKVMEHLYSEGFDLVGLAYKHEKGHIRFVTVKILPANNEAKDHG